MSVASPCIRICTLDAAGQVCLGCFRNLDEIGRWMQLSDAERAQVMARLPERRRRYELAAGLETVECSRCGARFGCGARAATECWCVSYPAVTPRAAAAGCLCPKCLAAAALEQSHG